MNEAIAELRAEGLQVPALSEAEQKVVGRMGFIDDAHIEIDVEAGLPDTYVSQQAERLKLYRELDSTKDEAELEAFESRLVDRFGPLPHAARELLNVVRLRWEAIRLGMERVKVKNGLMIVQFVGEENSPFYKSDVFMELLRRVTQQPARFVLKQHNNRLAMTVRNVKDVEEAWKPCNSCESDCRHREHAHQDGSLRCGGLRDGGTRGGVLGRVGRRSAAAPAAD